MLTVKGTREYYDNNKDFHEYVERVCRNGMTTVDDYLKSNICRTVAWVYKTWEIEKNGYENTNQSNQSEVS